MGALQSSLSQSGVCGPSLGLKYGAENAPAIVTRALPRAEIGITELRVYEPTGRLSYPLPKVDAFMICYMISPIPNNSYWEEGRQVSAFSLPAGVITIHDLRREPAAMMDKPFHSLLFYLPCAALGAVADQANVPRIDELHYSPGVAMLDETIARLGLALMPAFGMPEQVSQLFMDHVMLALATHTAQTYGGMQTVTRPLKGGLAPWQERLAKEMIARDLPGDVSLHDIARACGLSTGHFSRAFHRSTGLAPHAWLLQARVEAAKDMLRTRQRSLAEIARACGFSDQSHFARVFMRRVGLSPGAWRKVVVD